MQIILQPARRFLLLMGRLWLRGFLVFYKLDDWIRRRLTPSGQLFACFLIAAAVFGVNTRATTAYVLAALTSGFLLSSFAWARLFRPRLRFERRLPRYGVIDNVSEYSLRITNEGRRTLQDLLVEERLTHRPPRFKELGGPGNADPQINRFDRIVGYSRFSALMRVRAGAQTQPGRVARLGVGQSKTLKMRLSPSRRGEISLACISVSLVDPLGLVRAERRFALAGRLLALPRRERLPMLNVHGKGRNKKSGVDRVAVRGGATEMCGVREYRPGDPLRHIDWRGFARLGTPVVKQFEDLSRVDAVLFLDTVLSDDAPFEEAVSACASIALPTNRSALALPNLELVQIGEQGYSLSIGENAGTNTALLDALVSVRRSPAGRFENQCARLCAVANGSSTLIWVLAGWDRGREQLLRNLLSRGVYVTLINLLADGLRLDRSSYSENLKIIDLQLQQQSFLGESPGANVYTAWLQAKLPRRLTQGLSELLGETETTMRDQKTVEDTVRGSREFEDLNGQSQIIKPSSKLDALRP